VPGLETTLPLMLLAVKERELELGRIVELVAANPHRIFNTTAHRGTYTLMDVDQDCIIQNGALFTKAGWSPFAGMRVPGKVLEVWIRGTKVFNGSTQQVLVDPGFGRNRFEIVA
jgi:dihydroorotase-like cyclic amidohydrolase